MKLQAILFALLACGANAAFAADCGPLQMVNTVQMVRPDGSNKDFIPIQINGKELNFLFDTGGVTTMISMEAAEELKLPLRQGNFEVYDLVGNISRTQASVDQFALGRLNGKNMKFPVAPFGRGINIFSLNFMLPYDVDVDFGTDKLNFFSQEHCEGGVVYWKAAAVAVVPMTVRQGHMIVPVTLDGREWPAIIDTGADTSTLRMDIAQRSYDLAIGTEGTAEKGVLNGDQGLKIYAHTFKTLTFGGITVTNPEIVIIPDAVNRNGDRSQQLGSRAKLERDNIEGPPMLLGMDVLRRLRIYMAFGERKMYISQASSPAAAQPAQ